MVKLFVLPLKGEVPTLFIRNVEKIA